MRVKDLLALMIYFGLLPVVSLGVVVWFWLFFFLLFFFFLPEVWPEEEDVVLWPEPVLVLLLVPD